jgi:hypothetical protein
MKADDVRRIALSLVQPLYRGTFETISGIKAKLTQIIPFGSGDHYQNASPFGFVSWPVKGVLAFIHNLEGRLQSPIILGHLHVGRPVPSAAGEVIIYCTNAAGDSVPVKLVLGNDGVLRITASSKMLVDCDDIELGQGTIERIVNGETFKTFFNAHQHLGNLGAPTGPPITAMDNSELSSTVKAKT